VIGPSIKESEFYMENGIFDILMNNTQGTYYTNKNVNTQVPVDVSKATNSNQTLRVDVDLQLMAKTNFPWKGVCEDKDLTKLKLQNIMIVFNRVLDGANMTFILLIVWFMFSGLILNFFAVWPFLKAYCFDGENCVYKQSLYS